MQSEKITEITPVRETISDYAHIEAKVLQVMRDEIFLPLIEELELEERKVLRNSRDDLLEAIRAGKLSFHRGKFEGNFDSKISRELKKLGAKWKDGAWRISARDLPIEVTNALSASVSTFERKLKKLDDILSKVLPEKIAEKIDFTKLIDRTLWKVQGGLKATMRAITIVPNLTKDQSAKIAKEYSKNLELSIKDWGDKEILKLRKDVRAHVYEGGRYESLAKTIQKSYGVAQRKAKFLARQETSLLMTKFKESRYIDAGIPEYKWRCVVGSPAHPVRPMHKKLNDESLRGKIFRWDDPPVDDPTGTRHNPGENYNCRCVAVPVIRFK